MSKKINNKLTLNQQQELITTLKSRFEMNSIRHKDISWIDVYSRLEKNEHKLWSLFEMERTGGEPDVVGLDNTTGEIIDIDCVAESPTGRRSLCYDREAYDSRKENKPKSNVMDMAEEMGIELLDEEQYRNLQKLGTFDLKTSSWLQTPDFIRKLGGAIFGDYRYGNVFIYHNGAQSYYASRGFRALLKI